MADDLIERLCNPGTDLFSDAMDGAIASYATVGWIESKEGRDGEKLVRAKIAAAIKSYNEEILGAGYAPLAGALENQGRVSPETPGAPSNSADALAQRPVAMPEEDDLAKLIGTWKDEWEDIDDAKEPWFKYVARQLCSHVRLAAPASSPHDDAVLAALVRVRDRFFPADQPEQDRDADWEMVNTAIDAKKRAAQAPQREERRKPDAPRDRRKQLDDGGTEHDGRQGGGDRRATGQVIAAHEPDRPED